MIALVVTFCVVLLSVWLLSMMHLWLAMIWLLWVATGVTWFVRNMGRKSSPDRWYDRVLLAPVMPLAWLFGQINSRCSLITKE